MYCRQCGKNNKNEFQHCFNCGKLLDKNINKEKVFFVDTVLENSNYNKKTVITFVKPKNFITKHWCGGYSLGFSFWIIGVLLTALISSIAFAIDSRLKIQYSFFIVNLIELVSYPIVTWQLVGIWRSASLSIKKNGKNFWAATAKIMISINVLFLVVNFQVYQNLSQLSRDIPKYHIRLVNAGTEMELSGGMPIGTTEAVRSLLNKNQLIDTIHLNNVGGSVYESYKLYDLIKEKKLITYTSKDCVSACSLVFLAGRERYLGSNGRLGFHSPDVEGLSDYEFLITNNNYYREKYLQFIKLINDDFRNKLQQYGLPDSFIEKAMSTPSSNVWYPDKKELIAAKVIDAVVDASDFPGLSIDKWGEALKTQLSILSDPLFYAVFRYNPINYTKIRDALINGIKNGLPSDSIKNEVRTVFNNQILPQYLKTATNNAIIPYMEMQVEEMMYLEKLNPKKCADFIYPQLSQGRIDLSATLPENMMIKNTHALVYLIENAAKNPQNSDLSTTVKTDLVMIISNISKTIPTFIKVMEKPENYKDNPLLLCQVSLALYTQVLALPTDRAGATLRYLNHY